ncbi:MAG: GGDEF domain-containing protein [Lachnospiraceae bacterium]|nr:GGDEF domain-containing protein [Lachnospiraceae bacterium]
MTKAIRDSKFWGKLQALRKKMRSLTVRLPLTFMISGLLIVIIIVPIAYFWFQNRMISDYADRANAITSLMVPMIDGNLVNSYMDKDRDADAYAAIRKKLMGLKDNLPDLQYAHVFRYDSDGARVVFNMQDKGEKAVGAPGQLLQVEPAYAKVKDRLVRGEEIWVVTKNEEGYLYTYFKPVFDDLGVYQCHCRVVFTMTERHRQNISFIMSMLIIVAAAVALVLVFDVHIVRKGVIKPIRDMSECVKGFTYDTESDRFANMQAMEELNIHSQDEIEELYYEFTSVMKESLYYMTNLSRAKSDIQEQEEKLDQISETAYKDALTRVGNQASFNKFTDILTQEIADGTAKFAIVMVDLNNLKYVNDTFGHKFGDHYIKGCCNIICSIYKRSPVFRVGGDEFVVALRNEDYMSRLLRMTQITEAFMASYGQTDKEAYDRFSASVGMAEFTPGDETVDQVMKRADKAMYENKDKFKKKYGSYR